MQEENGTLSRAQHGIRNALLTSVAPTGTTAPLPLPAPDGVTPRA